MDEKKQERSITFYTVPLKIPYEEMLKTLVDDALLNNAIIDYSKELYSKKNIETFVTNKNLIVTEDGYKIVFYDEEAEAIEAEKLRRKTEK